MGPNVGHGVMSGGHRGSGSKDPPPAKQDKQPLKKLTEKRRRTVPNVVLTDEDIPYIEKARKAKQKASKKRR